jgi:large subunit ribosomal protein L32e
MSDLEKRKQIKARKPRFLMQNAGRIKRLHARWRKPKGTQSKLRRKHGSRKIVGPGYGSPKSVKYLNKDGIREVLVHSIEDLKGLKKDCAILIGRTVGKAKRVQILQKAIDMKLKISNVKDPEGFIKEINDRLTKKEEKKEEEKKQAQPKKTENSIEDKLSDEEKKKLEKKEIDRLLTKKF